VLAEQASNPYYALVGIQQLGEWVKHPAWERILDNFARCVRITRGEPQRYEVNPALFKQPEENALYAAYQAAAGKLDLVSNGNGNVQSFLAAFEPIVGTVSKYFGERPGEGVLVNTDDADVRRNRIGLLQAISAMQQGRADFSFLSGF
jgi:glycyl-tRNA synthetase beta subunit